MTTDRSEEGVSHAYGATEVERSAVADAGAAPAASRRGARGALSLIHI